MSIFDAIKKSVLEGFSAQMTLADIIISLGSAFLAGLFILAIYRLTRTGVSRNRQIESTLLLVTPISAMIVLTITSNLALSLGMVGALSIVRFRTAVKDASDTAFMFWSVASGITAGAHFYSSGGVELGSQVTHMEKPVLATSSRYGVVYDAGGHSLFQFSGKHEPFVYSPEGSNGILSARVNNSGWLTVTGLKSHYRGGVTVYNAHYEPVISLNYSSAFVTDAILSPDCRTVAVVTISQTDGAFQSTVHFHSTNAADPFATVPLDGFTVLDMDFDSNGLWLLGESSLITLSPKGEEQAQYHFDPDYLKGYTLDGDGFAALLLGKYRAGAAREVISVGHDAQVIARQELNGQVLSMSASGRYLALLAGQELNLYTKDLTPYNTLYDTQGARHAALYDDGSVLLADSQEAWLYIPS